MKLIVSSLLLLLAPIAYAGFLDDVVDTFGDAVETGFRLQTAPYESLIKAGDAVINEKSAEQIYQPYVNLGQSAGNTISGGSTLFVNPQQEIYKRVAEMANAAGGDAGSFVFDIATFQQRMSMELNNSSSQALANALRGQNPLQMTAAPLAAAIRAARERHASQARAIPDDVRTALANHFPASTLDRARFSVGNVEITLPNFIGQGAVFMAGHKNYGVVVDDIIVFAKEPGSFDDNRFFWAHEMTHVQQYERMGVENFAFEYLRDMGSSLEAEADNKGAAASQDHSMVGHTMRVAAQSQMGMQGPDPWAANRMPEMYVAQCIFPYDPRPINYLVTNTSKLIAVDPLSGNWSQIGWATPPNDPYSFAWDFRTPNSNMGVTLSGQIMQNTPAGFQQVGHVVRFQ